MHILYDNITSTLVAGVVLLVLFAMQIRIMNLNAQQTATYMTKKLSLDFADWLEDDLLEIGQNVEPGGKAFENPVVSDGLTTSFIFYKDSVDYAVNPPATVRTAVRYRLVDTGEAREVGGETVPLYRAVRETAVRTDPPAGWTPSSWTETGQSAGYLQHFEIEMLDADGQAVASPATVDVAFPDSIQQTHARFVMLPPFQDGDGSLRAMHWGTSLLLRY